MKDHDGKDLIEYVQDLEEKCENLSEQNRLLVERIKHLEGQCSGCEYYNKDYEECGAFECFGIECPPLPCEEK